MLEIFSSHTRLKLVCALQNVKTAIPAMGFLEFSKVASSCVVKGSQEYEFEGKGGGSKCGAQ